VNGSSKNSHPKVMPIPSKLGLPDEPEMHNQTVKLSYDTIVIINAGYDATYGVIGQFGLVRRFRDAR
jgi:hypothetical protein